MSKYEIMATEEKRYDADSKPDRSEYQGGASSSTTGARAGAREERTARTLITAEEMAQLRAEYKDAVGTEMQGAVERMVMDCLRDGLTIEVISYAITDVTAWAPRPSAQYLRAVLKRYQAFELFTKRDVLLDEYRRSQAREMWS